MYRQVKACSVVYLANGSDVHPVATLEDDKGGKAHIWIDDHCYQVGLEVGTGSIEGREGEFPIVCPVTHIFGEAFRVLKTLPDPA